MSEKEKKILDSLSSTLSKIPDGKKDWILGFAEGMAFMKEQEAPEEPAAD